MSRRNYVSWEAREQSYRKYWDYHFARYGRYMDLEKKLEWEMKPFEGDERITEESKAVIRKIQAQKIADAARKELLEQKKLIARLDNGETQLGFTTVQQEISHRHEIEEKFEFCCLLLADFRKKYGLA